MEVGRQTADDAATFMFEIAAFEPSDYDEAMALWQATEGLTLREVDSREAVLAYLAQNRGLSFVARDARNLVGAVLAGTDGRRGYLQHLAVAYPYRGNGLGRSLAQRVVDALAARGVHKCHLMVRCENEPAKAFWQHLGWTLRDDIVLMSHADDGAGTA
jgi:ribosomal protein S18 acetylase RimI-like enzyme